MPQYLLYLKLFIYSWKLSPSSFSGSIPLKRYFIMALFWPCFIGLNVFNSCFLLLDHFLFPAFKKTSIKQPVFILGIPRSGTTFLHKLLSMDRQFTTMTLAELLFSPSLCQKNFWCLINLIDNHTGKWLKKCVAQVEKRLLGSLNSIHKTGVFSPEEDYLSLLPVLSCFLLVLPIPCPETWRLAYFDKQFSPEEKQRVMSYYQRLIQRHLHYYGSNKTYLSKNPSFTPMIYSLKSTFPDARFIACFRNPAKALPSQINSILVGANLFHSNINRHYWRNQFINLFDFYYHHLFEAIKTFPKNQCAVSVMEHMSSEPCEIILKIYSQLSLNMSSDFKCKLQLEDKKAKQYKSTHIYSLSDLNLSACDIEQRFDFVYDYFKFPSSTLS